MKKYALTLGILVIGYAVFSQTLHSVRHSLNRAEQTLAELRRKTDERWLQSDSNTPISAFTSPDHIMQSARYKNSEDENIRLDSMVWEIKNVESEEWVKAGKFQYTYDESGTIDQTYVWDPESEQWLDSIKTEFSKEGNLRVQIDFEWNKEKNQWSSLRKWESENDENANRTLSVSYNWSEESKTWAPDDKSEWQYYSEQIKKNYARYNWIESQSDWVISAKTEYNTSGESLIEEYFQWDGTSMSNRTTQKTSNTYDDNGLLNKRIILAWDYELNDLLNNSKTEYFYSDQDMLSYEISYDWEDNVWVESSKIEYTYEDSGKTIISNELYKNLDETWITYNKEERRYNDSRLIYYERWRWDEWNSIWEGIWKYGYEYDENDILETFFLYEWDYDSNDWYGVEMYEYTNEDKQHIAYKGYNWDFTTSDWAFFEIGTYYYSDPNAVLNVANNGIEQTLTIYPNPTQGTFQLNNQLNVQSVQVLDLNGRLQKEFDVFQNAYNIQDLNPGIYSVLVRTVEGTDKFRIVKK